MANRIQFRRDTATNWFDANPLLSQGELGFETDTLKWKIGDGIAYWNDLDYAFTPSGPQDRISTGSYALVINADGTITAPSGILDLGAESTIKGTLFLASEGSPTGAGYSFQADGGYDTGMFSSGDGYIQFINNTQTTMQATTSGWNLSPNKQLSFDKDSVGDYNGMQLGAMADNYSTNFLNFLIGLYDPLLVNGTGVQVYDNLGGSAIILGNTTATGDIYGIWDTNTSTGQVRIISQDQGSAQNYTWEFTEKGGFKDPIGIVQNSTSTSNLSTIDPILVASYDTQQFDSSEHKIKIRDGALIYSTKLDVITDGTDSWKNEYSVVSNTSTMGSFAATIDGTQLNLTFTPTTATILSLVAENKLFPLQLPITPPPTTPPIGDYIAWYDTSSFTGSTWDDMSGNGYHGTVTGSPSVVSVSGNGAGAFDTIQGGTSDRIAFPGAILPSTYTMFYISRYSGATKQRIYTSGPGSTWLTGHHDNKAGVAYHQGGTTASTTWTDYYGTDWVLGTDQNDVNLFRTNGVVRSFTPDGVVGSNFQIGVNIKTDGETSDWQTAECIVYDRTLTGGEISDTEAYLAAKYGISI